jgi:hypothetical protein
MNDAGAGLWLILVVDGDGTYLETTDSALQARFVGLLGRALCRAASLRPSAQRSLGMGNLSP